MPGWASLSPRGILFQHETSLAETRMSLFAQYWPVLEPEEAVPVSDTILEPRQQQYRAASELASHTASSNSQSFSSGFDLGKHSGSIYGFRLLWMCMVCGDKPKVDLSLLGHEFIAQTELSVESLYKTSFATLSRQWLLTSFLSDLWVVTEDTVWTPQNKNKIQL